MPANPTIGGTTTLTPVSRTQPRGSTPEGDGNQAVAGIKQVAPFRPIEAQAVINIGGIKYLVVPHPAGPADQQKDANQQLGPSAKKSKKSPLNGQDSPTNPEAPESNKLPFLLRPSAEAMDSTEMSPPTFEIEETKDGKLFSSKIMIS